MNQLANFEKARAALQLCAKVDEAKAIRDKVEALRAYARQTNDVDMELWTAQIKLRATRRIGEISKALEKGHGTGKNGTVKSPRSGLLKKEALARAGLTKQAANRCEQIADIDEGKFERFLAEQREKRKPVTEAQVLTLVPRALKRAEALSNNDLLVSRTPPAEEIKGPFSCIVLDPPWDYSDEGDADQFSRGRPTYETMPFDRVLNLPIERLADRNAHLYLWITNRSLLKAGALLERWGFRYVTCLTWCKPSIGIGNYFRGSTEQILFGVRGSLPLLRRDVGTWFGAKRQGPHSTKPAEFYSLVESCSPGPWLEMFARTERPGWVAWGAEAAAAG